MTKFGRHGLPLPHRYPWLLYLTGDDHTYKTFRHIGHDSAKQQYSRRCKLPELFGKYVIASFKGWLLLQKGCDDNGLPCSCRNYRYYVLWNPSTLESINLAPLESGKNHVIDCFLLYEDGNGEGEDGSRKMLTLLVFEKTMPCIFRCRCLRDGGGGHWEAIHYRKEIKAYYEEYGEGDEYPLHLDVPISCNGKLYALTHNTGRLVEIEIKTGIDSVKKDFNHGANVDTSLSSTNKNDFNHGVIFIKWLDCEAPSCGLRSFVSEIFLVESRGEVFRIGIEAGTVFQGEPVYKEGLAVHVFKLNFSNMKWIKLDSIEGRVFFLCKWNNSYLNCFSLDVGEAEAEGVRGNCIYFIKEYEKYLYCYNMEDNSISVTLPCPNLQRPWRSPVWVMPDIVSLQNKRDNSENVDVEPLTTHENLNNVNVEKEKEGETLTTHVSDLGLDLLTYIAKKLLCFDYLLFRECCTMFRSAAPLIQWRRVLSGSEAVTPPRTCLVIPSNKSDCNKDIWCVVDPLVVGRKYFLTFPNPELLEDVVIQCSKDGWLLLCCFKEPKTIVFFNPFTKAVIRLPDLYTYDPQAGFTFSSLPYWEDCVTISIAYLIPRVSINIFFWGEANWETVEFEDSYLKFASNLNNPVFWKGAFYFLGQAGNLGVLTINRGGRHVWEILDNPRSPCSFSSHQNYLVECGGDLLSVFVGYMGGRVEVFKLSSSKLEWETVDTLGNYVLFVSQSSSFSTVAKKSEEGMQNRIYFPRLFEGNPVYYSLDTGKFHVVGSNDSLPDFCGTAELLACGWIEPSWC